MTTPVFDLPSEIKRLEQEARALLAVIDQKKAADCLARAPFKPGMTVQYGDKQRPKTGVIVRARWQEGDKGWAYKVKLTFKNGNSREDIVYSLFQYLACAAV